MPWHNYAFASTVLTDKLWLIHQKKDGTFADQLVLDFSDPDRPGEHRLVVDISLSSDDRFLFVTFLMEGTVSVYDVSDPFSPKPVLTDFKVGEQVNMVSQSWDGKRMYFTSSVFSAWDKRNKKGEYIDQYFKAYSWDGKTFTHKLTVDFLKEELGLPHLMRFGQNQLYGNRLPSKE